MMDKKTSEFRVASGNEELLAKNVPKKFNRLVDISRERLMPKSNRDVQDFTLRCAKVIRFLHTDPSLKNSLVLEGKIGSILVVYDAMKRSIDQVVYPKEISKELEMVQSRLRAAARLMKNDIRDAGIKEEKDIASIDELGVDLKSFEKAERFDQKLSICNLVVSEFARETETMLQYFRYKAGLVQGSGRRLNDYSLHYLVFALGDLFERDGKLDGAVMVSFAADQIHPIGNFWLMFESFCESFDTNIDKHIGDANLPNKVKKLCTRRKFAPNCTTNLTNDPDTQRLLDFMAAVHETKERR